MLKGDVLKVLWVFFVHDASKWGNEWPQELSYSLVLVVSIKRKKIWIEPKLTQ
jgi:hypothetical protein